MGQDQDRTRPVSRGEQKRVMELATLLPGALFAERYEIIEAVGAGGSAEVYRARDTLAGGEVALKVLYPGPGRSSLERLQREMRLVRKLHHPGILRVHDLGKSEGLLYTVSEMLEGETLRDRLAREGRLAPDEAERILRGMLEALALAHEHGVVHRDIKPGNVFLARSAEGAERVVILDFGLARETEGEGLTATGALLGTPEYCSPEQAEGMSELTPASDVYACGITFWQMLAGLPPFRGDSEIKILAAHVQDPLPSVSREIPGLPFRLRAPLLWMLEKEVPRRLHDAGAVLAQLDETGLSAALRARLRVARGRRAGSGRFGRGVFVAAGLACALLLGAAWAFAPRDITVSLEEIRWELGLGMSRSSDRFRGHARTAFLDERGLGPLRKTWLLSWERGPLRSKNTVWSARSPWHEFEQEYVGAEDLIKSVPSYPGQSGPYQIRDFTRWYMEGEACSALSWERGAGYTGALTIRCPESDLNKLGTLLHPGRFRDLRVVEHNPREFTIVASAISNWLGPRNVLVGIRAPSNSAGQLPPYLLSPVRLGESNAWILPLGAYRAINTVLEVEGDLIKVREGHGEEFLVRARDGVPVDVQGRDGLSEEAFLAARRDARAALFAAAGKRWAGRYDEAARILDESAGSLPRSSRWKPLLFYRAALAWQEHAWEAQSSSSLEQALEAIRSARQVDKVSARLALLEAELLARYGKGRAALALSDETWGMDRELGMYVWEWILVRRLSGESGVPTRLMEYFDGLPAWGAPLQLMLAHESGDRESAEALLEEREGKGGTWALYAYWGARVRLDDGDLQGALELLDDYTKMDVSADPEPVKGLRARLIVQIDPSTLSDELLEAAREELAFFEKDAATNIQSLYHLRFALEDAAFVAEARGEEARAAEYRARAASTFTPM